MIEEEIIKAIKSIDLKTYAESRNIALTKKGKDYFGICPFHNDKNPSLSITPSENLFHCFGCGKGGDIIKFVKLLDKTTFEEIIEKLKPHIPNKNSRKQKSVKPKPTINEATLIKLLSRIIDFYHTTFCEDIRAKQYLNKRGITNNQIFKDYKIGFANGTLIKTLPDDGLIIDQLKAIGILNDNGKEVFYGRVIFSLYDENNNPVGLYGRLIDGYMQNPIVKHMYLSGSRNGLFNRHVAKANDEIILTESIIDSLTLINAGINNTIPCFGTNGFNKHHLALLKQNSIQSVKVCFDADESGIFAARNIKFLLNAENIKSESIQLPENQDINSFFSLAANPKLEFEKLLNISQTQNPNEPKATKEKKYVATDFGFNMTLNNRIYEVKGIINKASKLKAMVKAVKYDNGKRRFYPDTVDFYSSRSRVFFTKGLCDLFNEDENIIKQDLDTLFECCEQYKGDTENNTNKKESEKDKISTTAKKQALEFGKSENLIELILEDFEKCGLVGEEANKILSYLVMTSRLQKNPLAVMILSSSGSGKTALQDCATDFCPPEDLVKITSLSGKALFYKEEISLKHKVLALEEGEGAKDAFYAIRALISSGYLKSETTIKDNLTGKLTTMENKVEGPTAVFYTTTNPETDPETKSRFFVTGIDESNNQTRKIKESQKLREFENDLFDELSKEEILLKHWNLQRLLDSVIVRNPFGKQLNFGDDRLACRRDQPKYLRLLKAIAFLRQMQKAIKSIYKNGKEFKYVEIDKKDVEIANWITNEILGKSLDELSIPGRNLLIIIDEMIDKIYKKLNLQDNSISKTSIEFTRRDIRDYSSWSNSRVHRYLKELVELEYIIPVTGKNGTLYRYLLAYENQGKLGAKFSLNLTSPEKLAA